MSGYQYPGMYNTSIDLANLNIHWHPGLRENSEFFAAFPAYEALSSGGELARRLHFNFHAVGCLWASLQVSPITLTPRDIYVFVDSCPDLAKAVFKIASIFSGIMRSTFVADIVSGRSIYFRIFQFLPLRTRDVVLMQIFDKDEISALLTLNALNRERTSVLKRIARIPPNERLSIAALAFYSFNQIRPYGSESSNLCRILDTITKIPADQRQEVTELTFLFISKEHIDNVINILKEISHILPEQRREVVKLTSSIFSISESHLPQTALLLQTIANIPSEERREIVELALPMIGRQMQGREINVILHIIADLPLNQRREVIELTISILTLKNYREIFSLLQTIIEIPLAQRREIVDLAKSIFTPYITHYDKVPILKEIARLPVEQRRKVIELAKAIFAPIEKKGLITHRAQIISKIAQIPIEKRHKVIEEALHFITPKMNDIERAGIVNMLS